MLHLLCNGLRCLRVWHGLGDKKEQEQKRRWTSKGEDERPISEDAEIEH